MKSTDLEKLEEIFANTHEVQQDSDFVRRDELEELLAKGAPSRAPETVEDDFIGVEMTCPKCGTSSRIDGIDGDEIIKAVNTVLGEVVDELRHVRAAADLNQTMVKGLAGLIRRHEAMEEEITELRKALTENAPLKKAVSDDYEDDLDDEPEPMAKGMLMAFRDPEMRNLAAKVGDMTNQQVDEVLLKAVEDGKAPESILAHKSASRSMHDLLANPDIRRILEESL